MFNKIKATLNLAKALLVEVLDILISRIIKCRIDAIEIVLLFSHPAHLLLPLLSIDLLKTIFYF